MQLKKTLTSIVLAGALSLTGCNVDNIPKQVPQLETITGIPLSVAESFANAYGTLATVIDVKGKKVLATTDYWGHINTQNVAKGVALIQSEIVDGDDELIELTGKYNGNTFIISSIAANGYKINY